jgi:UDP-glucose 4-epimerase
MKIRGSRIVVTGGAGFIGSHLVDVLLTRDNNVVVLDDFSSGSHLNLRHHASNPRLVIEQGDITNETWLNSRMQGARFVFHLATRNVRMSLRQPSRVHDVNVTGTFNVLKAAAASGVERLLYCSSSEVNGTATVVPMPEDYSYRPETIYGASKLAGEYYAQVFHRARWLSTVIARPHNNYGPREHYEGDKGEVIPRFILLALAGRPPVVYGDGTQTRDFTFVTETAETLVDLLECDAAVGQVVNVCRGEEVPIKRIAELILEFTGINMLPTFMPARPSDVLRLYGDASRLRGLVGKTPSISIRDGLARTVEWFRSNVPLTQQVLASLEQKNWQQLSYEPWLEHVMRQQMNAGDIAQPREPSP